MRQKNLVWNKDQESGLNRVREDLERLSDGKIRCDFPAFEALPMARISAPDQNKKKKR